MPDTKGYDTPFKDYTATKPSFDVHPTSDTPHAFPVPSNTPVKGTPTPQELPETTLWHGPKGGR